MRVLTVHTSLPETREWYKEYYVTHGASRNNLLTNPGVLFQTLAQDTAIIRALRSIHPDTQSMQVLDVGCGDGANLWLLERLGFAGFNLFGIDIQEDRIAKARENKPFPNFECMDAACQRFSDNTFDITMESTLFIHLTDDHLAAQIATEMVRVTKRNGYLVLTDWRYPKPGNSHYKALTKQRISSLFRVGNYTEASGTFRGPLLPPVGRFLSRYFASAYFPIHALFPFLSGMVTTVLKKV